MYVTAPKWGFGIIIIIIIIISRVSRDYVTISFTFGFVCPMAPTSRGELNQEDDRRVPI